MKNRICLYHSCVLLLSINVLITTKAQYQKCRTPKSTEKAMYDGGCVSLLECKIVADILQRNPSNVPLIIKTYISEANCGSFNESQYICCAFRHIRRDIRSKLIDVDATKNTSELKVEQVNPNHINKIPATNVNNEDNPVSKIPASTVAIEDHPNFRLLPERCGSTSADRLSNANVTEILEFKFMALLRYETPEGFKFQCGASLISNRYVLTAAHCVSGTTEKFVSVRLGEHDLRTDPDCFDVDDCVDKVADIPFEEIIVHENYRKNHFTDDIALIRLRNEANFSANNIGPICLPKTTVLRMQNLTQAVVSGWGTTENKTSSPVLLKAYLPIVHREACELIYKNYNLVLRDSHLCAGGKNAVDACRGDSGGPLFYSGVFQKNVVPRYVQYGIVSAGPSDCGRESFAGLYTSVPYFMKWILDHIRE